MSSLSAQNITFSHRLGQSRHFGRGLITTGLPPTPDISLHRAK